MGERPVDGASRRTGKTNFDRRDGRQPCGASPTCDALISDLFFRQPAVFAPGCAGGTQPMMQNRSFAGKSWTGRHATPVPDAHHADPFSVEPRRRGRSCEGRRWASRPGHALGLRLRARRR